MTDPHIDLDELETPGSNFNTKGEVPIGNSASGFGLNFNELTSGFFNFLERLRTQSGLGANLDPLPYESRKHFRNSQREFLLGWREVIDDALHRLDDRDVRENVRHSTTSTVGTNRGAVNKIEIEEIED